MGVLWKTVSFTLVSSTVAASYYFYFIHRDGYQYKRAHWRKIDHDVQDIIEKRQKSLVFQERNGVNQILKRGESQDVIYRPIKETMKDIWNEQIRTGVEWMYSIGK
ncbi:hypothetical protein NCAS_0B07340 [Naumovozyma castellii]|uniref:MICOS complex subunit MIC12 n=1 Tax=Naumovozyma castellii TaxID=27288 RepID=G0VA88_NAUCA|nr:hypothetical protein NCAS_0B07340 [Naumovozyma castellii CBS 4309]CCC68818.1 hypothetical protein NCAS_0B07340 [Naumovozyma castellii CBS 4309]